MSTPKEKATNEGLRPRANQSYDPRTKFAHMTPKELDFLFQLLEKVSEEMYKRGHADGAAKKPVSNQSFAIGKNNRLVIKTNLKKFTEKR